MAMINQEEVWDSIAESWNNFRQKPSEELKDINWKKGRLIDIGCGNCRNLLQFKNLELYGIDFSEKMLKQAEKFCKKNNLKVNLKKADMRKIPFKNNYFNYCLCLASMHNLSKEDADKTLKEIYRILKENGRCLIFVWNKYPRFILKRKETLIPWRKKEKVYYRYYYLYSYYEFKGLLKKNNFKILKSGKILSKNITFLIQK